jgi:DUF4097 and DUF4098 domain-containing protein YvlB
MRHRLITVGTCAAMALAMTSAGGRVLASSDRHAWPALAQAAVPDPLSAWPGAGFPGDEQDLRSEVSDRQTHTLAIGTSGSLELKTVTGQITCVAGTGSSATIEVIRRSRGRTDADAKQGLVDVRAEVDHKGERATVVAVYPTGRQPRPYSVDVSYVVTAPAGTRVSASSVSGDVSVRDVKGDVSATSVSGHVSIANAAQVGAAKSVSGNVSIVGLSSSSAVNVGSVSGNVTFESVKATQINAESVSGSIRFVNGGTTTGVAFKSVSGNIDYEGAIGRGGRYELTSHSGNVRVSASAAGFELQASTFSGAIRTEPQQALRSATSSSRSVRGTVGDGSAVLAVTTFSGNITIVTR